MISHKHKCIFIHIAKCAGSSVEYAFGVDLDNRNPEENEYLFGWDNEHKLWLQHATPQQLLDLNFVTEDQWKSYYKFIVYRNSWDRAQSDYKWMDSVKGINDTFENFILRKGNFKSILNDNSNDLYVGDHLDLQKEYFFLNGERIQYNSEIKFENLENGLLNVANDLGLNSNFFNYKINMSTNVKNWHYSHFYNNKKINLVSRIYQEDIEFFNFEFEDKRNFLQKISAQLFQ